MERRWEEDGERLKRERKMAKLTLGQLARMVDCRVSQVSDAEWGEADPARFLAALRALREGR